MDSSISFDRAADYYDETRAFPPGVAGLVIESLARLLLPDSLILEIGIGTGRVALPLFESGFNVTGFDLSRKMMERLLKKLPSPDVHPSLVQGNATSLPFLSGQFDVILAVHVLHLIPDWRRVIQEALRVTTPGGCFILGYERHSPDAIYDRIRGKWDEIARSYGYSRSQLVKYDPDELREFFLDLGSSREEWTACEWSITNTPQQVIGWINSRKSSSTWVVPEDIFPTTISELHLWAIHEFNNLDQPFSQTTKYIWERYRWKI